MDMAQTPLARSIVTLTAFVMIGFTQSSPLAFEVASVKRNPGGQGPNTRMNSSGAGLQFTAVPLLWIIAQAYKLPQSQVLGPSWMATESYDITAKTPQNTSADQRSMMLQTLLAERFHLTAHRENKDMQVLVMTVAKGGPKMKNTDQPNGGYRISQDGAIRHLNVHATMKALAPMLAGILHEPVVDQTELAGVFDIGLAWDVTSPTETTDNLLSAAEQQLGIRIDRKKVQMEVVVVGHVERAPTEN